MIALIKNGIVEEIKDMTNEEIIEASSGGYSNIVDITNYIPYPSVGWNFDGINFSAPAGSNQAPDMKITKLAMITRLDPEIAAIVAFSRGSGAYNIAVDVALIKQSLATYIDLSLDATITGLNNLVLLGLLTQERADIILNTVPAESERYKG